MTMDADRKALLDEIGKRLEEVERSKGSCVGHEALSRALGTLLRCQAAQLYERGQTAATSAKMAALVVGGVEAVRALIASLGG